VNRGSLSARPRSRAAGGGSTPPRPGRRAGR
jgi:hypothetical protein